MDLPSVPLPGNIEGDHPYRNLHARHQDPVRIGLTGCTFGEVPSLPAGAQLPTSSGVQTTPAKTLVSSVLTVHHQGLDSGCEK
jgi:hypothetical protein